jgi:hypothetical protein
MIGEKWPIFFWSSAPRYASHRFPIVYLYRDGDLVFLPLRHLFCPSRLIALAPIYCSLECLRKAWHQRLFALQSSVARNFYGVNGRGPRRSNSECLPSCRSCLQHLRALSPVTHLRDLVLSLTSMLASKTSAQRLHLKPGSSVQKGGPRHHFLIHLGAHWISCCPSAASPRVVSRESAD